MLTKYFTKQQLPELLIYSALWLVICIVSPFGLYLKASNDNFMDFYWIDVFKMWKSIFPFFILFLIHNFWLAPYFLLKRKTLSYILCLVTVLIVFQLALNSELFNREKHPDHPFRQEQQHPSPYKSERQNRLALPDFPPGRLEEESPVRSEQNFRKEDDKSQNILPEVKKPPRPGFPIHFPGPNGIRFIIALLMLGFNIGIKLLFKSQRDAETLKELESRNLRQQLNYLKHQISPHFFMNTLNNVHALIDIDTEKAKYTLLELSKLMRYLLYESEKNTIALSKEVEFLNHYLTLMRLRFTDQVKITAELPREIPEVQIPPLLFITFVENAFKHGISYQSESFICLSIRIKKDQICFHCINSCYSDDKSSQKGIGLENVQKRLYLLYGERYHLQLEKHADTFGAYLEIPIKI